MQQRLLGLRSGAVYVGLSYSSFRALIAAGTVPTVHLPRPALDGRIMRRVLVDVQDLDALISARKEPTR